MWKIQQGSTPRQNIWILQIRRVVPIRLWDAAVKLGGCGLIRSLDCFCHGELGMWNREVQTDFGGSGGWRMEWWCHWRHKCGCHRRSIDAQYAMFAFAWWPMPDFLHWRLAGLKQWRLVDSTLGGFVISWRDNVQRSSFWRWHRHCFCRHWAIAARTGAAFTTTCGRSTAKTKNILDCNHPLIAIGCTLLSALPNSCKAKVIQLSPKRCKGRMIEVSW